MSYTVTMYIPVAQLHINKHFACRWNRMRKPPFSYHRKVGAQYCSLKHKKLLSYALTHSTCTYNTSVRHSIKLLQVWRVTSTSCHFRWATYRYWSSNYALGKLGLSAQPRGLFSP